MISTTELGYMKHGEKPLSFYFTHMNVLIHDVDLNCLFTIHYMTFFIL
jgi:hypothetical protein